jgi:hypothetical protein
LKLIYPETFTVIYSDKSRPYILTSEDDITIGFFEACKFTGTYVTTQVGSEKLIKVKYKKGQYMSHARI